MVRFFTAECPYCGGSFQVFEGENSAICGHCGRQVLIDEYDARSKVDLSHSGEVHLTGASPFGCIVCGEQPSGQCSVCHVYLCKDHLWAVSGQGGTKLRCQRCASDGCNQGMIVVRQGKDAPGSPTPVQLSNTCPKCGGPLRYINVYQQYYCDKCKKYPYAQH